MFEIATDPRNPREYTRITRRIFLGEDGFRKEESWHELLSYVGFLQRFCRKKRFDLEEEPEIHNTHEVQLKSFAGCYRFEGEEQPLQPRRDSVKLTDPQFKDIITDISQWATMLGSPFLNAVLNVLSPVLGEDELILAYSSMLISYTESALAEYVPPLIQKTRFKGPSPIGRILIPQTARGSSSDQLSFVSQRIKFELESLPKLLMLRFHMELSEKLKDQARKFMAELRNEERTKSEPNSIYPLRIQRSSRAYHTNFVLSPSNRPLLPRMYEIDFRDSRILSKTRKQVLRSPSLSGILTLWEAYIGRRALTSQIMETVGGGYMLKPVCKIYELWVLHALITTVEKIVSARNRGERPKLQVLYSESDGYKTLPADFIFNDGEYRLIYNGGQVDSGASLSDFGKFDSWQRFQLRPDYVLTCRLDSYENVVLVADAKYKENVKMDDRRQMLAYLAYFGEVAQIEVDVMRFPYGLIVYTGGLNSIDGDKQEYTREKPRTTIVELCLKPWMDKSFKFIERIIEDSLS